MVGRIEALCVGQRSLFSSLITFCTAGLFILLHDASYNDSESHHTQESEDERKSTLWVSIRIDEC